MHRDITRDVCAYKQNKIKFRMYLTLLKVHIKVLEKLDLSTYPNLTHTTKTSRDCKLNKYHQRLGENENFCQKN